MARCGELVIRRRRGLVPTRCCASRISTALSFIWMHRKTGMARTRGYYSEPREPSVCCGFTWKLRRLSWSRKFWKIPNGSCDRDKYLPQMPETGQAPSLHDRMRDDRVRDNRVRDNRVRDNRGHDNRVRDNRGHHA